jgi:hypothetical protein
MKRILFAIAFIFLLGCINTNAQDTLPDFSVRDLSKGKVQISWVNKYANLVQLVVQRSFDSTKYFRSIFSAQSPWLPQNGFVDNNVAIGYKVYYRIQYVFEGGAYYFSKSKSPSSYKQIRVTPVNTTETKENKEDKEDKAEDKETKTKPEKEEKKVEKRYVKIYKVNKDSLIATIEYKDYKRYRDSITRNTKDTIQKTFDDDEIIIKPFVPKPVWKASSYIFTNEKGFIRLVLPLAKQRKYRIVFFDETNQEVLQIKQVKEPDLVLDKSNFIHSGWYFFELFEDEKLKEKNKFFVGKDR